MLEKLKTNLRRSTQPRLPCSRFFSSEAGAIRQYFYPTGWWVDGSCSGV